LNKKPIAVKAKPKEVPMPNGHFLMSSFERISADAAIHAGRDPNCMRQGFLIAERIIEVKPTGPTSGEIVWQWRVWDHLIQDFDKNKANFGAVGDHPELIDLNYYHRPNADWNHVSALDYNAQRDEILISTHVMDDPIFKSIMLKKKEEITRPPKTVRDLVTMNAMAALAAKQAQVEEK
jgi:hypothetical protein